MKIITNAEIGSVGSINEQLLEVLFKRRDEIDRAIAALGGSPQQPEGVRRPTLVVHSGDYAKMKPVHALERLLMSAGRGMTYDEVLPALAKGGLKTSKRILSIGIAQGGNEETGRRFYIDGDGKINLAAWRERAA